MKWLVSLILLFLVITTTGCSSVVASSNNKFAHSWLSKRPNSPKEFHWPLWRNIHSSQFNEVASLYKSQLIKLMSNKKHILLKEHEANKYAGKKLVNKRYFLIIRALNCKGGGHLLGINKKLSGVVVKNIIPTSCTNKDFKKTVLIASLDFFPEKFYSEVNIANDL